MDLRGIAQPSKIFLPHSAMIHNIDIYLAKATCCSLLKTPDTHLQTVILVRIWTVPRY
jgi:hypothetical protein